jgi:hypothetical protein
MSKGLRAVLKVASKTKQLDLIRPNRNKNYFAGSYSLSSSWHQNKGSFRISTPFAEKKLFTSHHFDDDDVGYKVNFDEETTVSFMDLEPW